jgi:hypothetical protein
MQQLMADKVATNTWNQGFCGEHSVQAEAQPSPISPETTGGKLSRVYKGEPSVQGSGALSAQRAREGSARYPHMLECFAL